jgi:hypothetical protein
VLERVALQRAGDRVMAAYSANCSRGSAAGAPCGNSTKAAGHGIAAITAVGYTVAAPSILANVDVWAWPVSASDHVKFAVRQNREFQRYILR